MNRNSLLIGHKANTIAGLTVLCDHMIYKEGNEERVFLKQDRDEIPAYIAQSDKGIDSSIYIRTRT